MRRQRLRGGLVRGGEGGSGGEVGIWAPESSLTGCLPVCDDRSGEEEGGAMNTNQLETLRLILLPDFKSS